MNTSQVISSLIKMVGRYAYINRDGVNIKFKTYCNPICEKNAPSERLENGRISPQKFLVICPSNPETPELTEGDIFKCGSVSYYVESSKILYFMEESAYQYAIAVIAHEEQ